MNLNLEELTVPQLYEKLVSIVIPDKNILIEELKSQLINGIIDLHEKQEQLILTGKISRNGELNYPPEILIGIINKVSNPHNPSDWILELRKLNGIFYNFYNQYSERRVDVKTPEELNRIRSIPGNFILYAEDFVPDSLDEINELDLMYSDIDSEKAVLLAGNLRNNNTLTRLNLYGNSIFDEGAIALADALLTNNTLEILNLGWNGITSIGAIALADALEYNKTLKVLDLLTNEIEMDGIEALEPYGDRASYPGNRASYPGQI